jgi:hypothetical protein
MARWLEDCLTVTSGSLPCLELEALFHQLRDQRLIERRHAIIVEAGSHGAEHRHFVGLGGEQFAVALVLLAHIAQRILGALAVELVDCHEIGEVEHVDLFQLRGGTELRRHHVQRQIDERHDGRIALANTGGFDNHQIETGQLAGGDDFGQRTEISLPVSRVASERMKMFGCSMAFMRMRSPSSAPPVRLRDGSMETSADLDAVALIETEAADDFVGQRRLAGTAGTGNAENRYGQRGRSLEQRLLQLWRNTVFEQGDDPGQQALDRRLAGRPAPAPAVGTPSGDIVVGMLHDFVDHALQAHMHAVFRGVDAGHAIGVQFLDFRRHDHAATAAEDLDVLATTGLEQVDHVFEELDVTALVGRDADALRVFLQRGIDDLLHRTVVAEVNHLGAGRLQNPAHDVDRGIMAVEQRGSGNETDLVLGLVRGQLLGNGQIGHDACLI